MYVSMCVCRVDSSSSLGERRSVVVWVWQVIVVDSSYRSSSSVCSRVNECMYVEGAEDFSVVLVCS
jgi:hypothetical protein